MMDIHEDFHIPVFVSLKKKPEVFHRLDSAANASAANASASNENNGKKNVDL